MENSLICCCFAVRSCIAATQRWVLSSLWWKHTKTYLTEVNIYKLHSPTWSGRPAGISHQQSTEWEHKQTRLVPNNSERLHRSTIFSLPSVTCLTLVTRFFFLQHCLWNWWSTMIKMLGDKWRASVLEFWFVRLEGATQRTNDDSSDCSSLYHYQLFFFFFFKATTCATCPHFVLGIVHQKEKGTCVL